MSNVIALVVSVAFIVGGAIVLIVTDHGSGNNGGYIATFLGLLGLLVTNLVQITNQKSIHADVKEIKTNVNND